MSWITKAVVLGIAFYVLLMIAEVAVHPEILAGAAVGAVLLAIVAGVFLYQNEHRIHTVEMALVWILVLLFVLYGVLCLTGVIPWI